jgi:hypothetical protein
LGFIESKETESLFFIIKLAFFITGKESIFLVGIVSFFTEGITIFSVDFMSCENPIFIKKKQQNKSKYDRFDCNAISAIFV